MTTVSGRPERVESKVTCDVYMRNCPSRQLVDKLGSKWVILVVLSLVDGSKRYSELRGEIRGVSEKMLTQTLRMLERDGLVTREVTPTVPVRTDYALTDLGLSLVGPIRVLKEWAEANMSSVADAQAAYDNAN